MKKIFLLIILFFCLILCGNFANLSAVPANPAPIEITQPDGTKITLRLKGDEFYSWFEDNDGYTVVQDTQTKVWSYAEKDNFGDLKPSKDIVGKVSPKMKGTRKNLKDDTRLSRAKERRKEFNSSLNKVLLKNSKHLSSISQKENDLQETNSNSVKARKSTSVNLPAATGTKTNFVLLVQFQNLPFNKSGSPFSGMSDAAIIGEFNKLFNTTGYSQDGAVGSVKDYFKEISYGQLEYKSVISPIITIEEDYENFGIQKGYDLYGYTDKGENYYACKTAKLIETALNKLENEHPNFLRDFVWSDTSIKEPEGFTVIHAGGGAETGYPADMIYIWSHQWDLYSAGYWSQKFGYGFTVNPVTIENVTFNHYHTEPAGRGQGGNTGITRIGTICHESLHFFGLPDLYDTTLVGSTYKSYGLGRFSVMASGSWNGNGGNRPGHPDAWCKYVLGWIEPKTATTGINYIDTSATDNKAFYIFEPSINNPNFDSKEYFLMENRQSEGFDIGLPGPERGLLIYHVDEKQWFNYTNNDDYTHYMVDIEEADGTADWTQDHLATASNYGLQSDYYRNNTVAVFNDDLTSSPNSKSYSGQLSGIKIAGISASGPTMSFYYDKNVVSSDLSNLIPYPNPARKNYMYITNLPVNAESFSLEIFTMKAQLVRVFSSDDLEFIETDGTVAGRIKWDLKNSNGENVAPGVYIVLVKADSKKKTFKIAVIR